MDDIKNLPLEKIRLTVRCRGGLRRAGVTTLGELAELTRNDLLKLRNLGKGTLGEIEDMLAEHGLTLAKKRKSPFLVEDYVRNIEARHPGLLARLGKESDEAVGASYGVSRQRIQQIRKILDVGPSSVPSVFPEESVHLLGTHSDIALAEMLGLPLYRVKHARESRGIPVFTYVPPFEGKIRAYEHLLGTISDSKVAKIAGVTTSEVQRFRKKHSIKTKVLSSKHADFVRLDYDEIRSLFYEGKTDAQIAQAVGTTAGTVQNYRTMKMGLLRTKSRTNISDEERAQMLQLRQTGMSAAKIAKQLGRSETAVKTFLKNASSS